MTSIYPEGPDSGDVVVTPAGETLTYRYPPGAWVSSSGSLSYPTFSYFDLRASTGFQTCPIDSNIEINLSAISGDDTGYSLPSGWTIEDGNARLAVPPGIYAISWWACLDKPATSHSTNMDLSIDVREMLPYRAPGLGNAFYSSQNLTPTVNGEYHTGTGTYKLYDSGWGDTKADIRFTVYNNSLTLAGYVRSQIQVVRLDA